MTLTVTNVGRGPALYVRAGLEADGTVTTAELEASRNELRATALLDAGDEMDLRFRTHERYESFAVLLDYLDLADNPYWTRIEVGRIAITDGRHDIDVLRVSRVTARQGGPVTPWGVPE